MAIVNVTIPNSFQKQVLYAPHQKLNAKTVGFIPGLEDDIRVYPESILSAFKNFLGYSNSETAFIGLDVAGFNGTDISISEGYILKAGDIYYIEPITISVTASAWYGFFEFILEEVNSDSVTLEFINPSTDIPYNTAAETRKKFKVSLQENYNTSATFPTTSSGYTRFIEYKKNGAFTPIISTKSVLEKTNQYKKSSYTEITLGNGESEILFGSNETGVKKITLDFDKSITLTASFQTPDLEAVWIDSKPISVLDESGKICIFIQGGDVVIKNRLGSSQKFLIERSL